MGESPLTTIIVFTFLGITGVLMTALDGNMTNGFNKKILLNIKSAILAGALAFSFLEMFR